MTEMDLALLLVWGGEGHKTEKKKGGGERGEEKLVFRDGRKRGRRECVEGAAWLWRRPGLPCVSPTRLLLLSTHLRDAFLSSMVSMSLDIFILCSFSLSFSFSPHPVLSVRPAQIVADIAFLSPWSLGLTSIAIAQEINTTDNRICLE